MYPRVVQFHDFSSSLCHFRSSSLSELVEPVSPTRLDSCAFRHRILSGPRLRHILQVLETYFYPTGNVLAGCTPDSLAPQQRGDLTVTSRFQVPHGPTLSRTLESERTTVLLSTYPSGLTIVSVSVARSHRT